MRRTSAMWLVLPLVMALPSVSLAQVAAPDSSAGLSAELSARFLPMAPDPASAASFLRAAVPAGVSDDTNGTWIDHEVGPGNRYLHSMIYDVAGHRAVIFGGLDTEPRLDVVTLDPSAGVEWTRPAVGG